MLSLWLSDGQKKDLIVRTEGSGARFTSKGIGGAGDLMAVHPLAFTFCQRYVIECKFWKSLEFCRFLRKKASNDDDLYKALLKVEKEAQQRNNCHWLLIARQNNVPTFLFYPTTDDRLTAALLPHTLELDHLLFHKSVRMMYFHEFLKFVRPMELVTEKEDGNCNLPMRPVSTQTNAATTG